MSYILDALRKAEHERHLEQPPHPVVPSPPQPIRSYLRVWLAIGLGLGIMGAALTFFMVQPQPGRQPVTAAPPTVAPAPAMTASLALTPPVPAPLAAPALEPVSQSAPPAPFVQETVSPPALPEPLRPPLPASRAPPRLETAPKTERMGGAAPESRELRPKPAPKPASGPSVTIGPEPPPLLDTLPPAARNGLPTLNLDLHAYSSDADKRFVVINGRRYREGESVGAGLVLDAITAGGAVLRRGSQQFRLSVRR